MEGHFEGDVYARAAGDLEQDRVYHPAEKKRIISWLRSGRDVSFLGPPSHQEHQAPDPSALGPECSDLPECPYGDSAIDCCRSCGTYSERGLYIFDSSHSSKIHHGLVENAAEPFDSEDWRRGLLQQALLGLNTTRLGEPDKLVAEVADWPLPRALRQGVAPNDKRAQKEVS